ncbi:MAG: TIGR03857 family LLM class F420-dependent oxidoreductase [Cumulibacter sp.]
MSAEHMLPELGFYALAGGATDIRAVVQESRDAEEIGIGSAFESERFATKEAATICGAIGAASEHLGIATGVTNFHTRTPMALAGHASTMQALTGGRYTLGLGRGVRPSLLGSGLDMSTTSELEDYARLFRRLLDGELVEGHDGPAGSWPRLMLNPPPVAPTPLLITAFGPQTLRLAAREYDAVVLHTFFTDETTKRCVDTVREECERIGRDPAEVRIWSCYATICTDGMDEDVILRKTVGRLAGYMQGYAELLVRTNGWDEQPIAAFRESEVVRSLRGPVDTIATPAQLREISDLLPAAWMEPAAIGTAAQCAAAVDRQFDLGVDGVIMHGASPEQLRTVVGEYRKVRRPDLHEGLSLNPGSRRG